MYQKLYCIPQSEQSVWHYQTMETGVVIYPNPTNDLQVNLQFNNPILKTMFFEIFNPEGTELMKGIIQPNESFKTIELSELTKGVYLILFKYDDKFEMKNFVVSK